MPGGHPKDANVGLGMVLQAWPEDPEANAQAAIAFPDMSKDVYVGDCQNDGPCLGPYHNTGPNTGPNLADPKRDHNFDNPPCGQCHITHKTRQRRAKAQVTVP